MFVHESREVRTLIVRLERGDRLPNVLTRMAPEHAITTAWITGIGAFEWVELCEYDQAAEAYRPSQRIDGPLELLSLEGNLSFKEGMPFAHLHATVSREREGRIEMFGGHVQDAHVFACELRIDCYDDLVLGRELDEKTGLSLWVAAAEPPPSPTPEPEPAGASWGDVAQASAAPVAARRAAQRPLRDATAPRFVPEALPARRRTTEQEFFEEPIPTKGDYVQHQAFGLCQVDGDDAAGAIVIRLASGVRKTIRLDALRVLAPRLEGDRRIYPLKARRR